MTFQDHLIEWISNKSDFHIRVLNQLNNRSNPDNVNACKSRKHVHGSKMRQPFGLLSKTFQDVGLIP